MRWLDTPYRHRAAYGADVNRRSVIDPADMTIGAPIGVDVTLRSRRQKFSDSSERPPISNQTGWYSTLRPSMVIEPADTTACLFVSRGAAC